MQSYLDNTFTFTEGTVLKVSLKYNLERVNVTTSLKSYDVTNELYVMHLYLKVTGSDLTCSLEQLNYVISTGFIKEHFCKLQINRIKWLVILLVNATDNSFIARLPIKNCHGTINVPISKVSKYYNYTYHLYQNSTTPFKFTLKGVPIHIQQRSDMLPFIEALCNLFVMEIHVNPDISNNGYLKYVKPTLKNSITPNSGQYQEIKVAYPWGFQIMNKNKKKRKVKSKLKKIHNL